MNVPTRFFTAFALLVGVMGLLSAEGTGQTKAVQLDDLARKAEIVAVGRVSNLKSEWSPDRTHIVTRVTLSVEEYVKGQDAATVTLTTLGGEVGEVGELYTHVPTFRQNEEVVVFLQKDREGQYRVSGGTQGKYTIERSRESGQLVVAGNRRIEEFTESVRRALQD
jgi:hypothetical protein